MSLPARPAEPTGTPTPTPPTGRHRRRRWCRRPPMRGCTACTSPTTCEPASTWVPEYVAEIARVRRAAPIEVVCGVEAKILDVKGTVDLPPDLRGVEQVVVSDHQFPTRSGPVTPSEMRRRIEAGEVLAFDAARRPRARDQPGRLRARARRRGPPVQRAPQGRHRPGPGRPGHARHARHRVPLRRCGGRGQREVAHPVHRRGAHDVRPRRRLRPLVRRARRRSPGRLGPRGRRPPR